MSVAPATTASASARARRSEQEFYERIAAQGGSVCPGQPWRGVMVKYRVICAEGHERAALPNTIQQGGGRCQKCAGRDPVSALAAFCKRVAELGGTVIEPSWLGTERPHRVICGEGHECAPRPNSVKQGQGLCVTCAGKDPRVAEAAFRACVAELGGTVVEPMVWRGVNRSHRVICAEGHECAPRPASIRAGQGLCSKCGHVQLGGPRALRTEAAFRKRVAELGGTIVEPVWLGGKRAHRVICAAGHECAPRPHDVQQGTGLCITCAGQDPRLAEAAFRVRVAELGGTVIEPTWLGVNRPHRTICALGHECAPYPNAVQQGGGLCRRCGVAAAGLANSARAEAAFRKDVAKLGGTLVEPLWLGTFQPHRAICANDHECTPCPHDLQKGGGMCRACKGRTWDRLYVVASPAVHRVKFGVTSFDFRRRLAVHRRAGYDEVIRSMAFADAHDLEQSVRATLRLAEIPPVQGVEYYDRSALPVILDIVDHWD